VLERKNLTAICKVVIKDREDLAALEPFGGTMLLKTLHWPDEIRSTKDLDLPDEEFEFKPAELAMAEQLVETMTGEFEPEKYKDEYQEALRQIIEAKVEGKEVVEPEVVEEGGKLIDLMAALEASVKAATGARDDAKPVSVSEAKKERAKRPAKAKEAAKATKEREEARPARRRKSA
jgi:DNA end-binding protein Ku